MQTASPDLCHSLGMSLGIQDQLRLDQYQPAKDAFALLVLLGCYVHLNVPVLASG